jgi:hypothetical protein
VNITREQLAEQTRREIDEAFHEWPREHEVEVAAEKARLNEQKSSATPDGDRGEREVESDGSGLPLQREFARERELETAPEVARIPTRYRPPRVIGNWSG